MVQNKSSAFPPGVPNWCCWSLQERDGEQQPPRDWCKGEGKYLSMLGTWVRMLANCLLGFSALQAALFHRATS